MSDLGAGIALNEEWDFEVDNTGDLTATTGMKELEKDIAFNVARQLDPVLGRPSTRGAEKRIEIGVQNALLNDSRISAINSLNVRQVDSNSNRYEISTSVQTADGPFELVFEVSP